MPSKDLPLSGAKAEFNRLTRPSAKKFASNVVNVVTGCVLMGIIVAVLDFTFTSAFEMIVSLIG